MQLGTVVDSYVVPPLQVTVSFVTFVMIDLFVVHFNFTSVPYATGNVRSVVTLTLTQLSGSAVQFAERISRIVIIQTVCFLMPKN